jgi:hypothetical protein
VGLGGGGGGNGKIVQIQKTLQKINNYQDFEITNLKKKATTNDNFLKIILIISTLNP